MRVDEIFEAVGLIVKGVNTTPDVGVNAISIEAGKFGNKVGPKGEVPIMSKDSYAVKKSPTTKLSISTKTKSPIVKK